MTRREAWPTRLMATVTMPSAIKPSMEPQDDDPGEGLCHSHRYEGVVQEIEPLQSAERTSERVHGNGQRHVEGEEQYEEAGLADQVLRDARDDVGQEDGEDHNADEGDQPEHREAEEGRVEGGGHLLVLLELEVPADEGNRSRWQIPIRAAQGTE